jgi:hypothetical protein
MMATRILLMFFSLFDLALSRCAQRASARGQTVIVHTSNSAVVRFQNIVENRPVR